jgi:hypothetical protein
VTTYSDWEGAVLKGPDARLSDLEAAVDGSKATYPLLGPDGEVSGLPLDSFDWRVRVVLTAPLDANEVAAMRDSDTDVIETEEIDEQPLSSSVTASRTGSEGRVTVDLNLLRNITEIRRLQEHYSDLKTWVLVSEGRPTDDPEALVGETIRQLTGVLSGCRVLEIRQGAGEAIQSVRARLNVARLMAHESHLRGLPDPIAGAGFFRELTDRI